MTHHHSLPTALLIAVFANVGEAQSPPTTYAARTLSLGVMALGDYEGDGAAVAAEWPVVRFSPRVSLGVGGMIGLQHNAEPYNQQTLTMYTLPVMGVGNLQYQHSPDSRLALYGGLTAGFTQVWVSNYTPGLGLDERGTHASIGAQIGARYRLARRMGLMAQVGVGDVPGVFAGAMWRW